MDGTTWRGATTTLVSYISPWSYRLPCRATPASPEREEEKAAKARQFAEMRAAGNKRGAREEEEYQYKIAQEHKKLADSFQASRAQQERQNRDKQEQLEKTWAEREAELKKREQE